MTLSTPSENGSNWAGNYRYKATQLYRPQTVGEIQYLVNNLGNIKALSIPAMYWWA